MHGLPADLVADLDLLVPRPDLGATMWRHPALVRRSYGPGIRWALDALGPRRARVLEVGAGAGTVARALAVAGHDVVALDPDGPSCAIARRTLAGAGAVVEAPLGADGLADGSFDAVRFGRSLHHVDDLEGAAARTAALLAPGGVVLVDEVALARVTGGPSAAFIAGGLARLAAAGDVPADAVPAVADVEALWARKIAHGHLHSLEAMLGALGRHLALAAPEWTPSLWSECAKHVADPARADAAAAALEAEEAAAIASGALPGVAFRCRGTLPC